MAATEARRIVFLCSGGGGNLSFIHYAIEQGWINGTIAAVLTDRQCQASAFAESAGLVNRCIGFNDHDQVELREELERINPDVVVTTVHKILCSAVVDAYRGKLVNLHYSLLPAFAGMIGDSPVKAAIEYGARFTGATAHLVDETVDGGRPLVQAAIPLHMEETDFGLLMNLVFRCGCITLMGAIHSVLNGNAACNEAVQLQILGRQCLISGADNVVGALGDERLWQQIAARTSTRG